MSEARVLLIGLLLAVLFIFSGWVNNWFFQWDPALWLTDGGILLIVLLPAARLLAIAHQYAAQNELGYSLGAIFICCMILISLGLSAFLLHS